MRTRSNSILGTRSSLESKTCRPAFVVGIMWMTISGKLGAQEMKSNH